MLQYSSMRTSDVFEAFGGSKRAVAEALGISLSAVYQWDELVPPASAMRLSAMRPEIPYDPEQYRGWNSPKRKNGKRRNH
jgi:DNA-binding transcriptional regulator YdaS (Cro superfamily)